MESRISTHYLSQRSKKGEKNFEGLKDDKKTRNNQNQLYQPVAKTQYSTHDKILVNHNSKPKDLFPVRKIHHTNTKTPKNNLKIKMPGKQKGQALIP